MKKYISIFFAILMMLTCFAPATAFADDSLENDTYFTQEESELPEYAYATYSLERATDLITGKNLFIEKSGTTLTIKGHTKGSSEVKKCGFTKVIVQRKKSTATSWSEYKTYKSLYSESNYYNLNKSLTVEKGYQYRVTATHYAKKSLFSTQKIEATTGYLTF